MNSQYRAWFTFVSIIVVACVVTTTFKVNQMHKVVLAEAERSKARDASLAFSMEIMGAMTCVTADADAEYGTVVKVRWRNGLLPEPGAEKPLALADVKFGDSLAIYTFASGSAVVPSEMCRGSLLQKVPPSLLQPSDLFGLNSKETDEEEPERGGIVLVN